MLAVQTSPQRNIQMFRTQPETEVRNIPMMRASTEAEKTECERTSKANEKKGMNAIPTDIYNRMLGHLFQNGKIRDVMMLVCAANWGMRYSDLVRVRFCHLFDSYGNLKKSFSLPNGEKKTGKQNIYYNNDAVWKIISYYLSQPYIKKTLHDFLFVSKSGNSPEIKVTEIKGEECTNPELKNIYVQVPLTYTAVSDLVKTTLQNIGINTVNRKDKTLEQNSDLKLNVHSLRKMFAENFIRTGVKLHRQGLLQVDFEVFDLLQKKMMHTNFDSTLRYTEFAEEDWETISLNMNIGLEILNQYV